MTPQQFLQLLRQRKVKYKVVDRYVDVEGDCNIGGLGLVEIPVQFRVVTGNFHCDHNQLTSLEGAPVSVGGDFYCYSNQLTSLRRGPRDVGGDFYCYSNQLTSLEGAPVSVGGIFYCHHNLLTSLRRGPRDVGGRFHCDHNQLTSLEGAPVSVGGGFYCDHNSVEFTEADIKRAMEQSRHSSVESVIDGLVGC
jgi:hypothetical protein